MIPTSSSLLMYRYARSISQPPFLPVAGVETRLTGLKSSSVRGELQMREAMYKHAEDMPSIDRPGSMSLRKHSR